MCWVFDAGFQAHLGFIWSAGSDLGRPTQASLPWHTVAKYSVICCLPLAIDTSFQPAPDWLPAPAAPTVRAVDPGTSGVNWDLPPFIWALGAGAGAGGAFVFVAWHNFHCPGQRNVPQQTAAALMEQKKATSFSLWLPTMEATME